MALVAQRALDRVKERPEAADLLPALHHSLAALLGPGESVGKVFEAMLAAGTSTSEQPDQSHLVGAPSTGSPCICMQCTLSGYMINTGLRVGHAHRWSIEVLAVFAAVIRKAHHLSDLLNKAAFPSPRAGLRQALYRRAGQPSSSAGRLEEAVLQLGQLAAGNLQVAGTKHGTAPAGQKALAEQLGSRLLGSPHGSTKTLAQASCQQ